MKLAGRGYACSQILLRMALEDRGRDSPELVRAMEGLAYGCGGGRATCGALAGGCCVLGLAAGKGSDEETASNRLPLMLQELSDWFFDRAGGAGGAISCEAIVGEQGPAAARQKCGLLVADIYQRTSEILARNGFVSELEYRLK
jgi:C_GCAxxG_C_C family probable redox protein